MIFTDQNDMNPSSFNRKLLPSMGKILDPAVFYSFSTKIILLPDGLIARTPITFNKSPSYLLLTYNLSSKRQVTPMQSVLLCKILLNLKLHNRQHRAEPFQQNLSPQLFHNLWCRQPIMNTQTALLNPNRLKFCADQQDCEGKSLQKLEK